MHSRVKASAQQRFDLLDFLGEQINTSEEFAIINEQLFTKSADGGLVLKGMEINVDGGPALINATLEELCIVTSAGIMHRRLATETQLTCGADEGMIATGTNFIEAEVFYVGDDNENRVFWDPLVDMEFTQATDTTLREDVRLISNPVGFSTGGAAINKTRIAIVITNGSVVERIHDNYGNVVYSGSPSNPTFAENRLFRLNDLNNDGDTNRFDFGSPRTDLTINSLKESFDALATQFKDLIGDGKLVDVNTNDWFAKMPVNMFALAQDRAIFMDGGSGRTWVVGTSTLSWTSTINIRQAGFAGIAQIVAGSTVLLTANGDILYVDLDRDSTITYNPTLQKTTFANWFSTHSKDKFPLAWRSNDIIYWRDGQVIEASAAVATLSISNVDDIDDNNPATQYFHIFGTAPDQIQLWLYGQQFHQAHYTELPAHIHANTLAVGAVTVGSALITHTHSDTFAVSPSSHNHQVLIANSSGSDTGIAGDSGPSFYRDNPPHAPDPGSQTGSLIANNSLSISGSVGGPNTVAHTHSLSGSITSIGVTPAIGSVRTSGTPKQWFDSLNIFIDGVNRTAVLLTQASLVKFGDGTSGHVIVTTGVQLDITAYVSGLGQHKVEFTLTGTSNGGRLRSVLYTLSIP